MSLSSAMVMLRFGETEDTDEGDICTLIHLVYAAKNPSKLSEVTVEVGSGLEWPRVVDQMPGLIAKYSATLKALYESICKKYGVDCNNGRGVGGWVVTHRVRRGVRDTVQHQEL